MAQIPNFKDWPFEIREKIYEGCLIYPKELIPFPASYELPNVREPRPKVKPWNALLYVDKQISAEAAEVFYGKNTWRISDSVAKVRRRLNGGDGSRPLLWKVHLPKMRNVTMALDVDALDPKVVRKVSREVRVKGGREQTYKQRRLNIHRELLPRLQDQWVLKLRRLADIDCLDSLDVVLSDAFCPGEHCRPIRLIVALLNEHVPWPVKITGWYVRLHGMRTDEEASYAHESGYLCEHCVDPTDEEDSYCTRSEPSASYDDPSWYDD